MAHGDDKRQLVGVARRRAFENYLRYGQWPGWPAETGPEKKAFGPVAKLRAKPTRFYVWRSLGDDRARAAHALRHGQIFAWDDPPSGGHPGSEPNCRCWAEPYFGDPGVPDTLQPLEHTYQPAATSADLWSSVESLTRPDGSVAESIVTLRDGTKVHSRFWRTLVARIVTLASGATVRIDSEGGTQTVRVGDEAMPVLRSAWTSRGPIFSSLSRAGFRFSPDLFPELGETDELRPDTLLDPLPALLSPNPIADGAPGLDLLGLALFALYAAQRAAPASQGMGEGDKPVLTIRTWTVSAATGVVPIRADALTAEQVRQQCKQFPNVLRWINETDVELSSVDTTALPARVFGSLFHHAAKEKFEAEKRVLPGLYEGLSAEISFDKSGTVVPYGSRGSTRLDFVEEVPPKAPEIVCDYEVKTGNAELAGNQLLRQAQRLSRRYPGALIVMMEIKSNEHPR
ncbi:phage minor head protein [Devosia sp. CAU 1758]